MLHAFGGPNNSTTQQQLRPDRPDQRDECHFSSTERHGGDMTQGPIDSMSSTHHGVRGTRFKKRKKSLPRRIKHRFKILWKKYWSLVIAIITGIIAALILSFIFQFL